MDTRDTAEQAELRRAARQVARELGPPTVADLDNTTRAERLGRAVAEAGWLELRDDSGAGAPLASAVEAAIVAEALGAHVADVAFAGPVLAADLARRAGTSGVVALAYQPALTGVAVVPGPQTTAPAYVVDSATKAGHDAYGLRPERDGFRLAPLPLEPAGEGGSDLTRRTTVVPTGTEVGAAVGTLVTEADLAGWTALGLALTTADLVGVMRGVLDVTVDYAVQRRQFGVPIGSFQAVQHLLADARCLLEGSASIAAYASWAADTLEAFDALDAARMAKAYCARAARTVCETAVQVHGGIGNTWDCIVHVYARRALLSTQWFGDDGQQLRALAGTDGLS